MIKSVTFLMSLIFGLLILTSVVRADPGGDFASMSSSSHAWSAGSGMVGGPGSGSIVMGGSTSSGTVAGNSISFDLLPSPVGHTHSGFSTSGSAWTAGAAETGNGVGFVGGGSWSSTGGVVVLP